MPIESVMPSNHLILCRPHLLLPSISPSIREGIGEPPSLAPWGGEGRTPAHTHAHTCAHKDIQESSSSLPTLSRGESCDLQPLREKDVGTEILHLSQRMSQKVLESFRREEQEGRWWGRESGHPRQREHGLVSPAWSQRRTSWEEWVHCLGQSVP